jgi:mono/diheme cytochrome c family protein
MSGFRVFAAIVLIALVAAALFAFGGFYNVAGDAPHANLTTAFLGQIRARSIAAQSQTIAVPPDLGDARRVAAGAAEYEEMCSQCHLAPGMEPTEISQGLYPTAPELAKGDDLTAAQQFWVVKHGLKFTAMPAWGKTHDDQLLWNLVAFVRKLPGLAPAQYKNMVANAPQEHDEMMHGMEMPAESDHHQETNHHQEGESK